MIMRNTIRSFFSTAVYILAASLVVLATMPSHVVAAGNASYSLTPSSGSHDINTDFSVTIYENSGAETINFAQADLSYDQTKLKFVAIDTSSTAFDGQASQGGGNGTVSIARFRTAGNTLTGSQLVASVKFTALVGSGSSAISFASSSYIVRSTDNTDIWNGVTTGGTYSFTAPSTGGTTTGGSSGGTSTTPSTGSTGSNSSGSSTSSGSSNSTKSSNGSTKSAAPTTNQTAPSPAPTPAVTPTTQTTVATYLVTIKITDSKKQPVAGAKVQLDKVSAVSDATGIASFTNITAGMHILKVTSKVGRASTAIAVKTTNEPFVVQQFSVQVKKTAPWLIYAAAGGATLLVAAGIAMLLRRRAWMRRNRNSSEASGAMVVVNGKQAETSRSTSHLAAPAPPAPVTTEPINEEVIKPSTTPTLQPKADKPASTAPVPTTVAAPIATAPKTEAPAKPMPQAQGADLPITATTPQKTAQPPEQPAQSPGAPPLISDSQ